MKFIAIPAFLVACFSTYAQVNNNACSCTKIGLDATWADSNKVSCYLIPVPRDVSNKAAGYFQLAVVMASSLRETNELPLLYLHGGPGIATLENLPKYLKSTTWNQIRQTRSLVFFDYRGTGFSEPNLCPDLGDSLKLMESRNLSPEKIAAYKIELFKKCRIMHQENGIDISTFSSFQSAEDAESIRNSMQIERWNVYGVSHGTTVALNLLKNHGNRIHSMILDSPYPPNAPWPDFVRPFAISFKVLEENAAIKANFPTIRNDFRKAVETLNKTPFPITMNNSGASYPFTGNDFAWSIWSAMLKPSAIPFVPLAIKELASGNTAFLSKWVVAFSDPNAFGKFSDYQSRAILCYEGRPKNESDTKAYLQKEYPDFTAFNIDFESDLCNAWQPNSAGRERFDPVLSDVPVLILSGEYDPVCPPFFGKLAAKTLSKSSFINVPAASHAAIHVDDCVRRLAINFLSNPLKKQSASCIENRAKISFITADLIPALSELTKK
jgi:pimeloyl-ACP methyl ester carboxylesterase